MLKLIWLLVLVLGSWGCGEGRSKQLQVVNDQELATDVFEFEEIFESYSIESTLQIKNFSGSSCSLKSSDFVVSGEDRFSFSVLAFEDLELDQHETVGIPVRFWPTRDRLYEATLQINSASCGSSQVSLRGFGKTFGKDEDGIVYSGAGYHPVGIGNFAKRLWNKLVGANNRVISKEDPNLEDTETVKLFYSYARWFQRNLEMNKHGVHVWFYRFNYPSYGLSSPWVSGMAQGVGIGVLARAYLMSGDPSYLITAQQALRAFEYEASEGGVVQYDGLGLPHYAEYPSRPKSFVLNGFIIGTLGIYDLWRVSKYEKAKEIFDIALQTITTRLPDYDLGTNTNYQLIMPIQTFTLQNKSVAPGQRVRVASFRFDAESVEDASFHFQVGGEASHGNEWWQAKLWQNRNNRNWSEPESDNEGRSFRYFEIPEANSFVKVNLRPPQNINSPGNYGFTIEYFDDFIGSFDVLIFDGKDSHLIGSIQGAQTNEWRSQRIAFSHGIRGGGTNKGYAQLHVDLLDTLYVLTADEIFKKYSERFASYIPLLER